MAACWLELPVSTSRNEFPFPANDDVVDPPAAVTSHGRDDVSMQQAPATLSLLLLLLDRIAGTAKGAC